MKLIAKLIVSLIMLVILAVAASAADKITIVLDPGHGGKDPGTIVGTKYESEYINELTSYLKGYLEETGKFDVHVTRGEDEYMKHLPRALVAERVDADIFISLHFNSTEASSKNGVEVLASVLDEWYPERLSKSITASIAAKTGLANGGVVRKADTGDSRGIYYWHDELQWDIPGPATSRKSDYYSAISWGTKLGYPAVIVEHAYLSNAKDLAVCDSADGIKKIARAEADAIIEYYTGHSHVYGSLTCDRRAGCCLEGVYSRKCITCGHRTDVMRTPADPNAHGFTTESKAATCTEDGYVSRECQIARNLREMGMEGISEHTSYENLPAYGHNITLELEREAGHAVDGYKKESCLNCGEVWEYVTEGDPHVFVRDSDELTCDSVTDKVTYRCTVCDALDERTEEIPPHEFESLEKIDAECETDGYEKLRCIACSLEKTETIPAKGHAYDDTVGDVRCDHPVETVSYTCKRCKTSVTEELKIPPHEFESVERLDAECETDGYEKLRCAVCSLEKTEVHPAIGHAYSEWVVTKEAGSFSDGEIVYTCRHDSSHVRSEAIPAEYSITTLIIAISAAVLVVGGIALLFIRAARRRLSEISADAALEISLDGEENTEGAESKTQV